MPTSTNDDMVGRFQRARTFAAGVAVGAVVVFVVGQMMPHLRSNVAHEDHTILPDIIEQQTEAIRAETIERFRRSLALDERDEREPFLAEEVDHKVRFYVDYAMRQVPGRVANDLRQNHGVVVGEPRS